MRRALPSVMAVGAVLLLASGSAASAGVNTARTARRPRVSGISDVFEAPAMTAYLKSRSGNVTAAVFDDEDATTWLYRPGIAQQTASIIKVDILATLLWQERAEGETIDADDQSEATQMIEQSNNDDATALWDEVSGSSGITSFDRAIGLDHTAPNTEGYWGETTTTAEDQLVLLRHVAYPNAVLDDAERDYELGLMENVASDEDWGVSEGASGRATVALKNGWLPLEWNDWQINSIGWIHGDGRNYLIAVLTTDNPTEQYGIDTIEGISSITFDLLGRDT